MPITPGERNAINTLLAAVNEQLNLIINAREDVLALLRIVNEINNDTIEDAILAQARARARAAAQQLVTILT